MCALHCRRRRRRYLEAFPASHRNGSRPSATGEASPDYLVAGSHAVVNALRFLPRARFVVTLRDPVDRFVSAFENKRADGKLNKAKKKKKKKPRRRRQPLSAAAD